MSGIALKTVKHLFAASAIRAVSAKRGPANTIGLAPIGVQWVGAQISCAVLGEADGSSVRKLAESSRHLLMRVSTSYRLAAGTLPVHASMQHCSGRHGSLAVERPFSVYPSQAAARVLDTVAHSASKCLEESDQCLTVVGRKIGPIIMT